MTPDPREAQRHPTRTLVVLAGAALAYALAQTMVVPALPDIQRTYGVGAADATWLLTIFLLTSSVTTPLLGRLGDMYGKERLLLVALGVFGARQPRRGARRLARGPHRRSRDPGRWAGRSSRWPSASSATSSRARRSRRASAPSRPCSGSAAAPGLVIAGVLVDHASLAWIFWLSLAGSILAAWGTWRYVPESPVRVRARIDWGGATLLGAVARRAAARRQPGQRLGLDLGRRARALRRRGRARRRVHRLRGPHGGPARRPRRSCAGDRCGRRTSSASPSASRCSARSSSSPSSCRRRPWPATASGRSVTASGLFLLPSSVVDVLRGPAQRPARRQPRLEAAARCWGRSRPPRRTSGSPSSTARSSGSTSARRSSGSASAWPSRRSPTSSWSAVPQDQTRRGDGDQHDRALGRRRRRGAGRRGARHGGDRHRRGGHVPGRERLHGGVRHERRRRARRPAGDARRCPATCAATGSRSRWPPPSPRRRRRGERRRPADAGDQGRRDRRRRRGDHVDPRHDDRQRRARDAVARAARRPVDDPVGLDGVPARPGHGHPAHGLGGRAVRAQARLDDRRVAASSSRARSAAWPGARRA